MSADDDFPHLIQYRDPFTGTHRSVVLCAVHEADLLRGLRAAATGSLGRSVGSPSRCDRCMDAAR